MKAIELFCGIGGFRLGTEPLGIRTIFANDINEKVVDVYEDNFGKGCVTKGDIRDIPVANIPEHELLCAGFPCQPFSSAGKKLGINDKVNGTLFKVIVEVLDFHKPKLFILENVRRLLSMQEGTHFQTIIEALSNLDYEIEWRLLNSTSFGIPQHRQRVFIVGRRKDLRIKTSLILNDANESDLFGDVDEKNFNSYKKQVKRFRNWGKATHKGWYDSNLPDDLELINKKSLNDILQNPEEVNPIYDYKENTLERIQQSEKVNRFYNGVEILYNQGGGARLGYTIFGTNGVSSTLTASTSRHYERYKIGDTYRRLTNVEYARLMGFPDDWCSALKLYDQHPAFGNAVVPDCVNWITTKLLESVDI